MSAAGYSFHVQKGESWSSLISASDASGSHINHTGYTVLMDIRTSPEESTTLYTLSAANGCVTINGSGDILLSLSSGITGSLGFDVGVYDLLVTSPGGTSNFYLRGKFVVEKTVTR